MAFIPCAPHSTDKAARPNSGLTSSPAMLPRTNQPTVKGRAMTKNADTRSAPASTPTPWRYVDESTPAETEMGLPNYAIESADGGFDIATLIGNEADARRICAAVNACGGITTEALEQNIIGEMINTCSELVEWVEAYAEEKGLSWGPVHKARAIIAKATGRAA